MGDRITGYALYGSRKNMVSDIRRHGIFTSCRQIGIFSIAQNIAKFQRKRYTIFMQKTGSRKSPYKVGGITL